MSKYILKYQIKGKYLNYYKEYYKEFNNMNELRLYLIENVNKIVVYSIYKITDLKES